MRTCAPPKGAECLCAKASLLTINSKNNQLMVMEEASGAGHASIGQAFALQANMCHFHVDNDGPRQHLKGLLKTI